MSVVRNVMRWNWAHLGADCCNSLRRQRKVIPVVDVAVSVIVNLDVERSSAPSTTDHVERTAVGVGTTDRLHLPADPGQ